ncbi:2 SAM dependent methyltransferase [Cryptosporidium ryanae]|uniref:2 SAM dependent methyltransferase n=1 Tax=Cryptosporidium ryanae TaxID=515981 RepID=UPI00351A03BA|nr:2 SAM dependent methyltransferase [Cryptosporidium ryanae]
MELLPNTVEDFSSSVYWGDFFRRCGGRGDRSFEWYGEFCDLEDLLVNSIAKSGDVEEKRSESKRIAHIGCGSSRLGAELYDRGFRNIVNIDFSKEVIEEMSKENQGRSGMRWLCMDVEKEFADYVSDEGNFGQFDVILDKGFLDAFLSSSTSDSKSMTKSREYVKQSLNLLKTGGKYVLITLGQEYVSKALSLNLYDTGCEIVVEPLVKIKGTKYLPYYIEITKKKQSNEFGSDKKPSFVLRGAEIFSSADDNISKRELSIWNLSKRLKELSVMYWDNKYIGLFSPGEIREYQLNSNESKSFFITVYDSINSNKNDKPTVGLLVPFGQEQDWLYSSRKGMEEISRQACCKRLIVISRLNEQTEEEQTQTIDEKRLVDEISGFISPLALKDSKRFPILTVGEDNGKTGRKRPNNAVKRCVYSCDSKYSKKIMVFDFKESELKIRRQMIFKSSPRLIQSEVTLERDSKNSNTNKGNFVFKYNKDLSNYYIGVILLSSLLVNKDRSPSGEAMKTLILGLGGGVLASALCNLHKNRIKVTVVEIDESVRDVAVNYFGVDEAKMDIVIRDAFEYVDFVSNASKDKYDFIVVDINSSNINDSLMCPGDEFIKFEFINKLIKMASAFGFIVFNVSCRDTERRHQVFVELETVLKAVKETQIAEDNYDHKTDKVDSAKKSTDNCPFDYDLKTIETGQDEINELWVIKRKTSKKCKNEINEFVSENSELFSKNECNKEGTDKSTWIKRLANI